jgi:multidrug efflux system membrane fusion protein
MKILFQDGQIIKKGDLLFEIDPRPFQVQLAEAQGQKAHDLALLENAVLDLQRYRVLFKEDSVPKQQLDTQEALVRQYEGTVKVDQGQIDNAKLQLTYSRITASIGGRIGLHLVDIGNIVHITDTGGLAVITQLQPIKVIFTIPEDDIPRVLDKFKAGARLLVEAYDREQTQRLATGNLTAIDNLIDTTTGTVRCEAEFPNENSELFPNQFVNAKLLLEVKRDATVIPVVAIQRGPQGTYVYVVKADQTVQVRTVKIGVTEADLVSIDSGLSPDELVVVDGAERLREGSKVQAQIQSATSFGG